jgi:murein DD-endopeptidase MepM/ murein hydrolase activator NlpD
MKRSWISAVLGARKLPPPSRPASRRVRLAVESLEERQLLSGLPSLSLPSLSLTDLSFANAGGASVGTPAVGEQVYLRVDYTTQHLPAGAQYRFEFAIDAATRDSGLLDSGATGAAAPAGMAGPWVVQSGQHTVSVRLDAGNAPWAKNLNVTKSFSFTPVTFAPQFATPLAGTPNQQWAVGNYVDLDPDPGFRDYRGGTYTYNGHDGIDIGLANFWAMDSLVTVRAVAAGKVIFVHDSESHDRNTDFAPKVFTDPGGNHVVIDHGNGWLTDYGHMQFGSILVHEGDTVRAGQALGWVGSSGNSDGPHLHFGVRHNVNLAGAPLNGKSRWEQSNVVEPFVAASTYWSDPLFARYAGDTPGALDWGTTDHNPDAVEMQNRPAEMDHFVRDGSEQVYFWAYVHGVNAGDHAKWVWRDPQGNVVRGGEGETAWTTQDAHGNYWIDSYNLPENAAKGKWTVDLVINDAVAASHTFRVFGPDVWPPQPPQPPPPAPLPVDPQMLALLFGSGHGHKHGHHHR